MAIYDLSLVSLDGTVTVPDVPLFPARYNSDDDGFPEWWESVVGQPVPVVDGNLHTSGWSPDDNHLTTKGGPGRLRLLGYRREQGWGYRDENDKFVGSNFLNAKINMSVRGISWVPNSTVYHLWLCSYFPGTINDSKICNHCRIAEDYTAKLQTGNWEDIEIILDPDPEKWIWGAGEGIYDTEQPIEQALRHTLDFHNVTLGADNSSAPGGAFELRHFEILYNRNGPGSSPPVEGTVVFDPPLNTASIGNSGYSIRGVSSAITAGGTQIRVTFKAPSSASASASHVSIGKHSTTYNTTATPVELKFGGQSGFSLSANGQITSDWAALTTATNDVLVTVIDSTSAGQIRTSGACGGGTYYNLNGTSWNSATPSGFTDSSSQYFGGKIEVK